MDKKELIAELLFLAFDKNVDGRTFCYLLDGIMEMFKKLN